MVRKRTRSSRKRYDSEENDTDSDYNIESPPASPAPKKYSLRQRKRPVFVDDFDYEDDGDEAAPTKLASDDEDFDVAGEIDEIYAAQIERTTKKPRIRYTTTNSEGIEETLENPEEYEDEGEPADENEDIIDDSNAIDFEDVIRADVVLNKHRLDYDNIIHRTEIKIQPITEPTTEKKKRGRKPKKLKEEIEDEEEPHEIELNPEELLETETEPENNTIIEENSPPNEYCAEVQDLEKDPVDGEEEHHLDPAIFLQTEIDDDKNDDKNEDDKNDNSTPTNNGVSDTNNGQKVTSPTTEKPVVSQVNNNYNKDHIVRNHKAEQQKNIVSFLTNRTTPVLPRHSLPTQNYIPQGCDDSDNESDSKQTDDLFFPSIYDSVISSSGSNNIRGTDISKCSENVKLSNNGVVSSLSAANEQNVHDDDDDDDVILIEDKQTEIIILDDD